MNATDYLLLSVNNRWYSIKPSNCLFTFMWETEYPSSSASFCFLARGGEKDAQPESRQTFEVAAGQASGPVNLVLSRQTIFFPVRASV